MNERATADEGGLPGLPPVAPNAVIFLGAILDRAGTKPRGPEGLDQRNAGGGRAGLIAGQRAKRPPASARGSSICKARTKGANCQRPESPTRT